MIVLIGGEKGGTGKTTLATNLAVWLVHRGADVLLLDTDPQASGSNWAAVRSESGIKLPVHCLQKHGDVTDAVRDVARRYDHVIIDAGGRDSRELRSAMLVAEVMYIPLRASQFDLWTVERMDELVKQARGFNSDLKAFTVLNMAPTNPVITESDDAQKMLAEFPNIPLCTALIRDRKVYRDATLEGKGVIEMNNPKATDEINALAETTYEQV